MATPKQNVRGLFAERNIPLDQDDVWLVQGTPVVKHKAVERLGAALGIRWDTPTFLRAERDEAVALVVGHIGDRSEWSVGEALIGSNYRVSPKVAAYPYAMAEKRGKDRVILKLAGLQGVYSEEEADDFKQRSPEPANEAPRPIQNAEGVSPQSREIYVNNSVERIAGFDSTAELLEWALMEKERVWPQYGISSHEPDGQRIVKVFRARMAILEGQSEAA